MTPPAAPVLPPLVPVDLSAATPVSAYLAATAAVCPFVEPAARAGLLSATEVTPDCNAAADVHPRLFEHLVPQVERFRAARRAVPGPAERLLVCHTVVIRLPPVLDADAVRLLNWPNLLGWSLKQLYTPKAVVLGFVRKGVAERAAGGRAVPAAPFHAVVIRSRVATADGRFFPNNPAMLRAMETAEDDGGDAFGSVPGRVPDVFDPAALRGDDTYGRVLTWVRAAAGSGGGEPKSRARRVRP